MLVVRYLRDRCIATYVAGRVMTRVAACSLSRDDRFLRYPRLSVNGNLWSRHRFISFRTFNKTTTQRETK
jgi:hypothetical protein